MAGYRYESQLFTCAAQALGCNSTVSSSGLSMGIQGLKSA